MVYKNSTYGTVEKKPFEFARCKICGKEINPPRSHKNQRYTTCVQHCNSHTRGARGRVYKERRLAEVRALGLVP